MKVKSETEAKMQAILEKLGIPLKVVWVSDVDKKVHGLIEESSRTLFIYDVNEEDAWQTLLHETLEWKLREVTRVYRFIINSLIETLEKIAYSRKEEFLEFLPQFFQLVKEERKVEQK